MRSLHRLLFALGFTCTLASALPRFAAADAPPAAPGASQPLAYTEKGDSIPLRPLDDPANPYRAKYGDLERWMFTHGESFAQWKARSEAELDAVRREHPGLAAMPDTSVYLDVDPAGWLEPLGGDDAYQTWSAQPVTPAEAFNRTYNALPPSQLGPRYFIVAPEAQLSDDLRRQKAEQMERWRIRNQPPIPAWLGSHPPLEAVFMPNGDILTYGELDLHYQARRQFTAYQMFEAPEGETWYRYSAQGQLLGQYANGTQNKPDWFSLYWPQMKPTLDAFPRQGKEMNVNYCGYWVGLTNPLRMEPPDYKLPPITVYAAWTYDGKPLDLSRPVPPELRGLMRQLDQRELTADYALELKYGVAGLAGPSPFEGRPDGPQLVDAAARPWPVIAHGTMDSQQFLRVTPREAADNPYRGQYAQWDDWVWQHHDVVKPQPARTSVLGQAPEPVNFYGTWRMLWLPVDDNGVLEPLALAGQTAARSRLGYDHRNPNGRRWQPGNYQFYAAGDLDDTAWTALQAEQLRLTLPLYPAIPDWLSSQPAADVLFVPNGDVITLGPLGSFDPAPDTKFADRFKAGQSAPYYVYGPDGQPKGTVPSGQSWTSRYRSAELQAKLDAAVAAGQHLDEEDGYTLVFAGPLSAQDDQQHWHVVDPAPALLAAYDWDGTPVDITQPLTRQDYHCIELQWHEVKWVHDVRVLEQVH